LEKSDERETRPPTWVGFECHLKLAGLCIKLGLLDTIAAEKSFKLLFGGVASLDVVPVVKWGSPKWDPRRVRKKPLLASRHAQVGVRHIVSLVVQSQLYAWSRCSQM
jgi:hypothetical protein